MDLKRIALILSLIMLLGISAVNAKIGQGVDDFDGSKSVSSSTSIEEDGWLSFSKKTSSTSKEYFISSSLKTLRYIKFSREDAEIKIDDLPVQKILVKDVGSMPSPLNSQIAFIDVNIGVPAEIAQQIVSAKRLAIRIHKENNPPFVYVLPESVLAEWKEVMATEK